MNSVINEINMISIDPIYTYNTQYNHRQDLYKKFKGMALRDEYNSGFFSRNDHSYLKFFSLLVVNDESTQKCT